MKTVAVVLSGCGHMDGAEIRETVGTLWALSQHNVIVEAFAPDAHQQGVIDHRSGKPMHETRNILTEAARIMRGKIKPLSELPHTEYQALVMPGGFGVAKYLCTFATDGADGKILYPELESELRALHASEMPIGAFCVAPVLLALAFKDIPLEMTLGAPGEEANEIVKLGHKHIVKRPHEYHVDKLNKIVTSPAYMYDDAVLADVFEGIKESIDLLIEMLIEYKGM
jgi:enhancing lycopene biosynthesis protein 2